MTLNPLTRRFDLPYPSDTPGRCANPDCRNGPGGTRKRWGPGEDCYATITWGVWVCSRECGPPPPGKVKAKNKSTAKPERAGLYPSVADRELVCAYHGCLAKAIKPGDHYYDSIDGPVHAACSTPIPIERDPRQGKFGFTDG